MGFIFYKKSPRYISPSKARKIIEALPPFVTPVGIFVNQKERAVKEICRLTRVQTIQFHGDEDPSLCKRFKDYKLIKAFRVTADFDFSITKKYKVDSYLFDAYQEDVFGGTGKSFNWNILKGQKFDKPVILSGGISAENVQKAFEEIAPFAVDVSSSIEKMPGIKNHREMQAFFDIVNFKK